MWFIVFLSFFLIHSIHPPTSIFAVYYQNFASTTITASIAENRVTLFGYTSPKSRVELSSPRVFAVTYSDDLGYFIFDKSILPRNPLDLCLISFDNHQRSTTPTCIPAPPPYNTHTNIGPILLPPTISLENSQINPNSTVISSGQAIPNSIVSINFYKVNNTGKSFPKEAQAYSIPAVTISTDNLGNFNLNLPTAYSSDYRLYASTKFQENYSPKSNTLIYHLPSFFSLFLQKYPFLYILIPLLIIILNILGTFFYLKSELFYLQSKIYLPAIATHFPVVQNHLPAITSCKVIKHS